MGKRGRQAKDLRFSKRSVAALRVLITTTGLERVVRLISEPGAVYQLAQESRSNAMKHYQVS